MKDKNKEHAFLSKRRKLQKLKKTSTLLVRNMIGLLSQERRLF